jgi:hypothetical protein
MKSKHLLLFMLTCISLTNVFAQPVIGLQKTIGGNDDDEFTCMSFAKDGGLIIGGYSNSNKSGDKLGDSKGGYDYWILLLTSKGVIRGQGTIGGNNNDYISAIEQTADGGYILGGYSSSNISGNKTENSKGDYDYWIVKLDGAGNIQWDKTIGGISADYLQTLKQTSDGGYILGGYSFSNMSGDKTENSRGAGDYWVVKLDGSGNIQWEKTMGGNYVEYLTDIIQTKDGYLIGGSSGSPISGEKTDSSRGSTDYWIVKLDNTGNIQWDKTYGGRNADDISALLQTPDGGYLLGGTSASRKSGEKVQQSRGFDDYWVVKTDSLGQIKWSNTYGGETYDICHSLEPTSDGGYMLAGYSASNIFGEKTENSRGGYDYWIIKISGNGAKQWDKTIGGEQFDILPKTKEIGINKYIVAGSSQSGIGGDKTADGKGAWDYWLVELRYSKPDSALAVAGLPNNMEASTGKINAGFSVYPNPAKDILHVQNTGKATYTLSNQSGNIMLTKAITNSGDIDVSQLLPGIYFLSNNTKDIKQKIIINR